MKTCEFSWVESKEGLPPHFACGWTDYVLIALPDGRWVKASAHFWAGDLLFWEDTHHNKYRPDEITHWAAVPAPPFAEVTQ